MADVTRVVETIFRVVDRATAPTDKIAKKFQSLHGTASKLSNTVAGPLTRALAGLGLGLGVGMLARKLSTVYEAADEASDAITAAYIASGRFASLGQADEFARSAEMGAKAYERMEAAAVRGVAPTKVYADVFRTIAGPALEKTRASQEDIARFTENLIPVMGAMTGSVEGAANQARIFAFAMQGIGGRPPRELLKVTKMTTKEWQKLVKQGPNKLFEVVSDKLGKVAPQMNKLFDEPGTYLTQLRNQADRLFRILGVPVMDRLSAKAKELLGWVSANEAEAKRIATVWGDKIATGIDYALRGAKFMAQHAKAIAVTLGIVLGAPKAIGAAMTAMTLVRGISMATIAVSRFASLMVLSGGSFTAAMALTVGNMAKVGLAFQTAGLVALVGGLAYALGSLADNALGLSDSISKRLAKAAGIDPQDIDRKAALSRAEIQRRADNMTMATARQMLVAGKGKDLTSNMRRVLMARGISMEAFGEDAKAQEIARRRAAKKGKGGAEGATSEFSKDWKPDLANVTNDFRGSRFDIRQAFAEGFDPDRIAVAFSNDLVTLSERRLQAGQTPVNVIR